jgi:MFS transporter, DHA1 family, multidrug resistance protein
LTRAQAATSNNLRWYLAMNGAKTPERSRGAHKGMNGKTRGVFSAGLALGLLSAIGPLAIDLYLPALPTMTHDLHASPGEVQRTLSAFFLALAVAQIPIGSFGDRFGRKLPLYLGLSLFVIASIACAFAPNAQALVALRFVEGFGVCAGTACSRAMIRDLHQGHEAARLMAFSFLIIGISPVLAPAVGSWLLAVTTWRGLFLILALLGVGGLVVAAMLPESLPPARRIPVRQPILPAYGALVGNARFIAAAVIAGLATTVPYAYVTAAPFVFTGVFGLHARTYTLLLGANAVCSIGLTQLSPKLMRQWGARRLILRAMGLGVLLTVTLGAAALLGIGGVILFQVYSMLMFCMIGLALTPAAISALDAGKTGAGAAAGMLGTLQLVVTACASGLVSVFPAFSLAPLLSIVLGCAVISWILCWLTMAAPQKKEG